MYPLKTEVGQIDRRKKTAGHATLQFFYGNFELLDTL